MSRSSTNILVFSWAFILLSIFGVGLALAQKSEDVKDLGNYIAGECQLGNSFYKKSDLKVAEKTIFSKNAVAFSVLGTSAEKYRIIVDYNLIRSTRNKIGLKLAAEKESGRFGNLSIAPLINGVENSSISGQKGEPNVSPYSNSEIEIDSDKTVIGLILKDGDKCETKITTALTVDFGQGEPYSSQLDKNLKPLNSAEIELSSGSNLYGSRDWINFSKVIDQGFEVLTYKPQAKKWVKENQSGQPGKAYVIKNPSKNSIKIKRPEDLRIPNDIDSPTVTKGWNLLYLADGQSIKDMKLYFNQDNLNFISKKSFTISELINNGQASKNIYLIKSNKLTQYDLTSKESPDTGGFWFYISREPSVDLKQINLAVSIEGGGETYSKGAFIPFKVIILNNDEFSHYLVSTNTDDSCQIKLEVTDRKGEKVFDGSGKKNCLSWLNLDELSSGSKKEYNYTWNVPDNLSGEYSVKAYLNYSRIKSDLIIGETKVVIK